MDSRFKRPIIFFDLETTGLNITRDRIVEISLVKLNPDGTRVERTRRINPEMPIPAEATAVHGITNDDVKDCPTFRQIAKSLCEMMTGCDIAGFNSNHFDVLVLDEEFHRAGVKFDFHRCNMIDVQTIFHKREPRNLTAAYRFYCGKDLENAHSANADTLATLEVFLAQLERYPDLPQSMEKLAAYSSQNRNVDLAGRIILDDKGREIINFGKHKGRLVEDVLRNEPGYYGWIMSSDFTGDTKDAFTRIKLRCK